ncbi:ankyrin repeat-containing domain protein [Tirmania nivea]|nr:ankyrin repeat-containing domain protein [Tirmania nivea]
MADPLSTISGVAGLLSLATALAQKGLRHTSNVRNCPNEAQQLVSEVSVLTVVLGQLSALATSKWALLKETGEILEKYREVAVESGSRLKKTCQKVVWPFQGKEVEGALVKLRELRDNFTIAVTVDSSHTMSEMSDRMKNITNEQQNVKKIMENERLQATIQWLSPLEPQKRHEDVRKVRVKGTGNWFLQAEKFQTWLSVDDAGCDSTAARPRTSAILQYCDYRDQKDQTETNLLGSLLSQFLACQSLPKSTFDKILDICEAMQRKREPLNLEKAIEVILLVVQSSWVFICIDAVDELSQATQLSFLKSLDKVIHGTDRPTARLANMLRGAEASITVTANEVNIRRFVELQIAESDHEAMDDKLREEIIETIVAKSGGMFLLPQLHIKAVLEEPTISKRRKALHALPAGLYGAYKVTLARIEEHPKSIRDLAMSLLTWTFLATRLMTVTEIQHALAVKLGDEEFDMDDVPSERAILSSCIGLVIIDRETTTVRLVHYSLQEFFQKHEEEFFPTGHNSIARICLTYINFEEFTGPYEEIVGQKSSELDAMMRRYPLVRYAALQWASHASKQLDSVVSELLFKMVLRNISGTPMTMLMCIIHQPILHVQKCHWNGILRFSSLHALAYLGNKCMMEYILEGLTAHRLVETVVDAEDGFGWTPLAYAAAADVNANPGIGWTPLLVAARFGQVSTVRMLLEHNRVDVNAGMFTAMDALRIVAQNIFYEMSFVISSEETVTGLTALVFAIQIRHAEMVDLLLSHSGVDVNVRIDSNATVFMFAVLVAIGKMRGETTEASLDIVRALLNHGVDVNTRDNEGNTALMFAVGSRSRRILVVLQLLLNHSNVDVNARSENGDTALICGGRSGNVEAVQMLLSHCGIEVNTRGEEGRTGLSWAAFQGHVEVLKLFLDYEGVELDAKDHGGNTALELATMTLSEAERHGLVKRTNLKRWNPMLPARNREERCGEIVKLLTDRGAKRGSELEDASSCLRGEISPLPSVSETPQNS